MSVDTRWEHAKSEVMAAAEDAVLEMWRANDTLQALLTLQMAEHVHLAEALARSGTERDRDVEVRLTSTALAAEAGISDVTMANRLHEAARLK